MSIRRPILVALGLVVVFFTTSACALASADGSRASTGGAMTSYVDGISDQSLPAWDGNFEVSRFAGLFDDTWVHGPNAHIIFARYVVQWNVMSGDYPKYLAEFEAWLDDVTSIES